MNLDDRSRVNCTWGCLYVWECARVSVSVSVRVSAHGCARVHVSASVFVRAYV